MRYTLKPVNIHDGYLDLSDVIMVGDAFKMGAAFVIMPTHVDPDSANKFASFIFEKLGITCSAMGFSDVIIFKDLNDLPMLEILAEGRSASDNDNVYDFVIVRE